MFCSKCGKEIPDGIKFCGFCGAALTEESPAGEAGNIGTGNTAYARQEFVQPQGNKKSNYKIIAGIVIAILVICVMGSGIGRRSYKQTVKDGLKSIQIQSAEKLLKQFPKEYLDYVDDTFDMSDGEFGDSVQDLLEYEDETLKEEYGKHYKIKFKITDVDKYSKDRLDDLNQRLYDSYKFDKKKTAKAAAEVKVEITLSGSGKKDSTEYEFEMMKIGRKWYFTPQLGSILTPFTW